MDFYRKTTQKNKLKTTRNHKLHKYIVIMFRRSFPILSFTRFGFRGLYGSGLGIRSYHETKRYAFVIDPAYGLVKKLRSQHSLSFPSETINPFPSSFARNLIHPQSNHVVSKYASQYYTSTTCHLGEYPIQFYASELLSSKSSTHEPNTHTIMLYPEQIKLTNIREQDIPYVIELCKEDEIVADSNKKHITVYFFCDTKTIEQSVMLFQWFSYCFRCATSHHIDYLFSSGNLKNDQDSMVIVQKGDKKMMFTHLMTLREVDVIVNQVLSY